jgi:hypothetical protein
MRSILATVVYGFIPESSGFGGRPSDYPEEYDGEGPVPKSLFWSAVTAVVMAAWLAMVIWLATVWRDRLDPWFGKVAMWVEDVIMGKKGMGWAITRIGDGRVSEHINGRSEKSAWKDKDPEMGLKA